MASINNQFKKDEVALPDGKKKIIYFMGPSFDGKTKGMV